MTAKGQDSLDWDLNGQMTTGITSSMTWTWDGKLQSASAGGASIDLKYAPGFDRVYKESTVNQTMTKSKYIVDPTGDMSLILLEVDPDDNDPNTSIRKTYLYANSQVIAQHDGHYGDDIYFYLHDRLGSVRQVIDTDANVENKYVYQPFGESFASEVAETITNDFKFTGQFYDSEIEQYYLRARMYDPAAYRFASRDPYEGSFENPLELHRYLYCLNEPVDYCDPTGESLILGLVGGMGGSAWMRSQEAKARAGQLAAVTAVAGYMLWHVSQRNEAYSAAIAAAWHEIDGLFDMGLELAQAGGLGYAADRTAGWGRKTIGSIITDNRLRGSNIEGCPRPPGGPDWKDILKMTWDDIVKAAKAGKQWAKVIKKEMLKPYNWPE
jgi:RHS repeat-associated protein